MKEEQVRAAFETADHIRRSKIGAASTLDQSVFTFLRELIQTDAPNSVGPFTSLLFVASLAFTAHPKTSAKLVAQFVFDGKPLRNWTTVKQWYIRKKSLIPPILITDS